MNLRMNFDTYTMGFSNRSWDETLEVLTAFHIERLIDIRTLPGSKHTPQFNLEHLQQELPKAGVEYIHLKSLGGLRKPRKESTLNAAWQNSGFRGYADYMQTPQFEEALNQLITLIREKTSVYCCTEAVSGAAIANSYRMRCSRAAITQAISSTLQRSNRTS